MIQTIKNSVYTERLKTLPPRDLFYNITEIKELLHKQFRNAKSSWELFDVQAAACAELAIHDNLLGAIGVGHGKTLISFLAFEILESKRGVLFVPANLREKTKRDLIFYRKHFKLSTEFEIKSYSFLSQLKNKNWLFEKNPDLIVADECHALKDPSSTRTKRFLYYTKKYPEIRFVGLSGTITRNSLFDYAHLLRVVQKQNCILPENWGELILWAGWLDAHKPYQLKNTIIRPGALSFLGTTKAAAQRSYGEKLASAHAVALSQNLEVNCALNFSTTKIEISETVQKNLDQLNSLWELPNGEIVTDILQHWRYSQEIACGFFYEWSPPPPENWLLTRSFWKKYVREQIKKGRGDSELDVWNKTDNKIKQLWAEIKDSYHYNVKTNWLDPTNLERVAEIFEKQKTQRKILWTSSIAVGEQLSKILQIPFFGANDSRILTAQHPCIASVFAHGEGKNLQFYNYNLIVSPPASAQIWEQLIGRTHRFGQNADAVHFEIILFTDYDQRAVQKAKKEAEYVELSTQNKPKLLIGNWL